MQSLIFGLLSLTQSLRNHMLFAATNKFLEYFWLNI